VRHHLVQRIIRAYDEHKGRNEQLSLDLRNNAGNSAPSSLVRTFVSSADREASLAEVPPASTPQQPNDIVE
jgi:hypothetical protein